MAPLFIPAVEKGATAMRQIWKEISLEDLPVREDLKLYAAYGAPQIDVPIRLNVNENPYPPSQKLVASIAAAIAEAGTNANRSPDREFVKLRASLASYLTHDTGVALDASQVWAGNGSNEVLQQILQAFGGPGRTALTFTPTYPMYDEYCRTTFTQLHNVPRTESFAIDTLQAVDVIQSLQPNVIFLTSPNNSTGTALPMEDIQAILEVAPGIVVVDEAYGEFRRDGVASAVTLLPGNPRLVVSRTMSKAFKFAGV